MARETIAYVLRMFPQLSETFIANEVLELERLGVPVRIYSYRRPKAPFTHASARSIRAPITYLPDPLWRHPCELLGSHRVIRRREPERYRAMWRSALSYSLRRRHIDTWKRFLQAGALANLLYESDVRHLHAHFAHEATRVAMMASGLTGIPFSFTAHARDIYSRDVDAELLRDKVSAAEFVVTVSHYNREWITGLIGGPMAQRIRVLYNGVDLDTFAPDGGKAREPDLVLGVGRLVEKKGFAHLVEACRILRNRGVRFHCEIVGDGEERRGLERAIRRKGLVEIVRLVGARSQEELPALYRRAALVAMPAVVARDGNRDALPTVLLEAIATGTPVVASRLTGITEIVDDGENGYLIEPGDAGALANAIERLLAEPKLRERMGAAGRRKAETCFDLATNVRTLYGLLDCERREAAEAATV